MITERQKKLEEKSNAKNKKEIQKQKKILILREILTCKKLKTPEEDVDNSPNTNRANMKLFSDKELSNNHEKKMEEVAIKQLQNIPP